jgi:class 3 adenylate cyclase
LHTGECEVRGDDIGGIGVHIGARVSALAAPNDVLVSSTLRDLVIGSGIEFEDRGAHTLKGVPGEWRLLWGAAFLLFIHRQPAPRPDAEAVRWCEP